MVNERVSRSKIMSKGRKIPILLSSDEQKIHWLKRSFCWVRVRVRIVI